MPMAKRMSSLAAACGVALFVAAAATAYTVPGIPKGSPGGAPTKPKLVGQQPRSEKGKEDLRAAERAAHSLGVALAGFTDEELADHGPFQIKADIPTAGKLSCSVDINQPGNFELIGADSKTYNAAGHHKFVYEFDARGESELKDVKGISLKLLVECRFKPKGGEYVSGSDTLRTLG